MKVIWRRMSGKVMQHVPEGECGEEHSQAADDVQNSHGNLGYAESLTQIVQRRKCWCVMPGVYPHCLY